MPRVKLYPGPRQTDNMHHAFALVRRVLTENPAGLQFHDLVRAGLAAGASASTSTSTSTSTAAVASGASKKAAAPVKTTGSQRRSQVLAAASKTVVPEGHPFVSNNFLKKRILPVLTSQDLIRKRAIPWDGVSPKTPGCDYRFSLATPPAVAGPRTKSTDADAGADTDAAAPTRAVALPPAPRAPRWDLERHWARLVSGPNEALSTGRQYEQHREAVGRWEKDMSFRPRPALRRFGSGGADGVDAAETGASLVPRKPLNVREERDVWAWKGRSAHLTTPLERTHLSVRRQEARPEKERRRVEEAAQRMVDAQKLWAAHLREKRQGKLRAKEAAAGPGAGAEAEARDEVRV